MSPESHARRRRVAHSFPLSLPFAPLDLVLERSQVLPLPLLNDYRRGDVDGAFAPRDGGQPVLYDDAGDGHVVVGRVGDAPVAELAGVAAGGEFAGPALDEGFGSLAR